MKTFLATLFACVACSTATFVFPAVTLTSGTAGTTGYVAAGLSATSVAVGAAAIAGLAIAKTALFLAYQADQRRRAKRSTVTPIDFAPMFEGIADTDDCGQLLLDPSRTLASVSRGSPLAPSVSNTFPTSST